MKIKNNKKDMQLQIIYDNLKACAQIETKRESGYLTDLKTGEKHKILKSLNELNLNNDEFFKKFGFYPTCYNPRLVYSDGSPDFQKSLRNLALEAIEYNLTEFKGIMHHAYITVFEYMENYENTFKLFYLDNGDIVLKSIEDKMQYNILVTNMDDNMCLIQVKIKY